MFRTVLLQVAVAALIFAAMGEVGRSATPTHAFMAFEIGATQGGLPFSSIGVSNLDGSNRRDVTPRLRRGERRADTNPTWSPDGTRIAFLRSYGRVSGLYVVNGDGTGVRRLLSIPGRGVAQRHRLVSGRIEARLRSPWL